MTTTINYSKRSDNIHLDRHILQDINNETYYKVDVVPYENKWRYLVSGKIRSFNFSGYLGTIVFSSAANSTTTTIEVDNYNNTLENVSFTEDMQMVYIEKTGETGVTTNFMKPYIIHINPDIIVMNTYGVHIILDIDILNVETIEKHLGEPFYCISVGLIGRQAQSLKQVFSYNLLTEHIKEDTVQGKYVSPPSDAIGGQVCNIYKYIDGKTYYYLTPHTNLFYNNAIVEPLVRYDNDKLYRNTQNNNPTVGDGTDNGDNEEGV